MVKRNAHTAVVTVPGSGGKVVNGEWVNGESPIQLEVKGHYDPVSNSRVVIKVNSQGNEKEVHGEFYTRAKAVKEASHLHIDSIGIDVDIISWEQYQSHSVIYV